MRNDDIATALLLAASDMISCSHLQPDQAAQAPQEVMPDELILTQFADDILTRRSKSLHACLGSTVRPKAIATLHLLTSIAATGRTLTGRLVKMLDMSSDAFSKLAHPPR